MNPGDKVRRVINPEILKTGNAFSEMEEGCLSVPGIHKKVPGRAGSRSGIPMKQVS